MKKYLLLSATTTSEWDNCTFALIELNRETIALFKKMERCANEAIKMYDINQIVKYGDYVYFFADTIELPETCIDKYYQIQDQIISLSDQQVEKFTRPENTVGLGEIRCDKTGITFVSLGKHTNEEFSCETSYRELTGAKAKAAKS